MALISLKNIVVAFGGPRVFDDLSLQLEPGERVALLGRNGAGKTTLMKVIAGENQVDDGEIVRQKGVEITHLPQEVSQSFEGTVFDIVASGLGKRGELLKDYHHVSQQLHKEQTPQLMAMLDRLQNELDRTQSWDISYQVELVISRMKLDLESDFKQLSGGQKRRVLLAKALVIKPEILLLDEPTNHLDIDTINWLEGFLRDYSGTLLFVTHDRMFMQHLATRIVELDRGKLFSWTCDYKTFLERRQMALDNEAAQRSEFDKKLAQEELWIRQGVKARRTRNEGRIKVLERLRQEKKAQRQLIGQVNMKAQEAEQSGRLVMKVSNLSYSYGDKCLFEKYSTQIMRGDKIGIIGPNGSGKTTLIRLLLGKLPPQKGTVRIGTNVEVAYYDQLREQLDEEKSVIENICGQADTVVIKGKPRHIIGYMQDFLFSPERARTPVKVLSGGERNRLFLARLFTKPSNVLVMDEPTNDLDMETLELLEELLMEYSGTILLVSHDRAFLNNVVTSTIVLEGDGTISEYAGGYDDWLNQRQSANVNQSSRAKSDDEKPQRHDKPKPRKLSFKEEKELAALVVQIEQLEREQSELYALMGEESFYKKSAQEIKRAQDKLKEVEEKLLRAFERWSYLEDLKKEIS
ncbi:MAG: ATP-binding cassette domain-containing protein [Candidatus Omnitrophota bacterium]